MNNIRYFFEKFRRGYVFELNMEEQKDVCCNFDYINHYKFTFNNMIVAHDLSCVKFFDDYGNNISFDGVVSISKIDEMVYGIDCKVGAFNKKTWVIHVHSVQSYKVKK